jgi:hypothetical protein
VNELFREVDRERPVETVRLARGAENENEPRAELGMSPARLERDLTAHAVTDEQCLLGATAHGWEHRCEVVCVPRDAEVHLAGIDPPIVPPFFASNATFGIGMDSSAVRMGVSARPRWQTESKNMVTKYFMEKMMVSARESRKITKLIEGVGLITRPARLAADHVERHERAEDVFAAGIDDKRFPRR